MFNNWSLSLNINISHSLTSPETKTKGTTIFYNTLNKTPYTSKPPSLTRWEADLSVSILLRDWRAAVCTTFAASKCASYHETFYKVIDRWYFTPLRLSKIYPDTDPKFWRKCRETGSLSHILWYCRYVQQFWSQVFTLLSELTHQHMKPTPERALFHIGVADLKLTCC